MSTRDRVGVQVPKYCGVGIRVRFRVWYKIGVQVPGFLGACIRVRIMARVRVRLMVSCFKIC